jgi:hypothetical protein
LRVPSRKRSVNGFNYAVPICHDVMVAESQHAIAFAREETVPSRVTLFILCLEMLSAVDLNDQARVVAHEVDDEGSNRCLAAKACAVEPVRAHRIPDNPLGIGQVSAQRARTDAQLGRDLPGWLF